LGFAVVAGDLEKPWAVGLNSSGRVVKGAGQTGVIGVLVLTKTKPIGAYVDVMQDGEIVECTGLVAGTKYYGVAADGTLNTTNTNVPVGHTVEADRLVVRVGRGAGA
jgi:hypothetical protein